MTEHSAHRGLPALWDDHARFDPLWAVLSSDDKRDRAWDLRDFMKQGEREIALAIQRCGQLGLTIAPDAALDFGCGVGRLTQALARRFNRVVGVDISAEMIRLAGAVNRYPDRAEYVHVGLDGVSRFSPGSFSFVYSSIVLQHVPPDLTPTYLTQFLNLLQPGGILMFQLPSHRMEPVQIEIRPMADSAYQASLDLGRSVPGTMAGGETHQVVVRVTNMSATPWVQREVGSLRVGNHWFDESGELMVAQDDGRTSIPQTVPAGGTFEVDLSVTSPQAAGKYWLEVDVVHEGISWFALKGSSRARALVSVVAGATEPATRLEMDESPVPAYGTSDLELMPLAPGASEPEAFPMYGLAQDIAVDCLQSGGGEIIAIEDDPRAGPEWRSYRYFVRKAVR